MGLDDSILKKYCENISYKSTAAINEPDLIKEFFKYQNMNNELGEELYAYDLSSNMRSFDFWFSKRNDEPRHFPVRAGEIYFIDLGAYNLKYETGFLHSCLILKQCSKMILVIPGSTKRYGRNNFLIEDVNAGDGFKEDTGVLIDQMRFVSITRIRGRKLGSVCPDTLKRIQRKVFENSFPSLFKEFSELEIDKENYIDQVNEKDKEIEFLKNDISQKEEELLCLKKQMEEQSRHIDE